MCESEKVCVCEREPLEDAQDACGPVASATDDRVVLAGRGVYDEDVVVQLLSVISTGCACAHACGSALAIGSV
jgi:hypothetical protein